MADIVNLRTARKRRDRELAAAEAAENRVRHGRTKAEKQADTMTAEQAKRVLDQSQLED